MTENLRNELPKRNRERTRQVIQNLANCDSHLFLEYVCASGSSYTELISASSASLYPGIVNFAAPFIIKSLNLIIGGTLPFPPPPAYPVNPQSVCFKQYA